MENHLSDEKTYFVKDVPCSLVVNNMYKENYKDACFFLDKAKNSTDTFEKRKYLRAAAVFYVACIDAWLAQRVKGALREKADNGIGLSNQCH